MIDLIEAKTELQEAALAVLEVCKRTKEHNTTAPHLNMEDVLVIVQFLHWHIVTNARVVGLSTGFILVCVCVCVCVCVRYLMYLCTGGLVIRTT